MISDKERKKRDVKRDFRGLLAMNLPESLPLRNIFYLRL